MVRLVPPLPVCSDAEFVNGGIERIWLSREVAPEGPVGLYIGLNPSTAGATDNDHTIVKEMEFARRFCWSGFWKTNLFTCVETHSAKLKAMRYRAAVGEYGDEVLRSLIPRVLEIVVCWGSQVPKDKILRVSEVLEIIKQYRAPGSRLRCFGVSKQGHPVHPLMLAYDTPLVDFELPSLVRRR